MMDIRITDDLSKQDEGAVEVTVTLPGGERRWCFFMTPAALTACGDFIEGTRTRLHCGAAHMFVVSEPLTEDLIRKALETVEARGELSDRTRPMTGDRRPGSETGSLTTLPALVLSRPGAGPIRYMALPEGPEAPPFLDAVLGRAGGTDESEALKRTLAGIERPAELMVFVAAACPHCPNAVRQAIRVALACEMVSVSIVDAQKFPELASRLGARTVPLTVLDGQRSWSEVVPASALAEAVVSRGSPEHEAAVFRSLLERGRFADAAEKLRSGAGDLFTAEWGTSTTSSRIGLLLTADEALESDRSALDALVPELLKSVSSEDAALRGDTADLLGRIGHGSAASSLERLRRDSNPDVAEIAAEALAEIEARR